MKTMVLLCTALAACTPFSPDLGDAPYLCADGQCPTGYTCTTTAEPAPRDKVCVAAGGDVPDGGTNGFECLDDTAFGDNDEKEGAFQTPVAASTASFSALAAICPELDEDHYAVQVVTNGSNLKVTTSWESGKPISVSILNSAGTSIGNGVPDGDQAFVACVTNLPPSTYYAKAFSNDATVKNNYRIAIEIVDSTDPACVP